MTDDVVYVENFRMIVGDYLPMWIAGRINGHRTRPVLDLPAVFQPLNVDHISFARLERLFDSGSSNSSPLALSKW